MHVDEIHRSQIGFTGPTEIEIGRACNMVDPVTRMGWYRWVASKGRKS